MPRTLALLFSISAASVFAQQGLPDGAGKATTVRVCTGCHGAEMFSGARKTEPEWNHTVTAMTTEKGVEISDADFATVLKYLSANLGMSSRKVNINKATAGDLEKALEIPAAQAEAIVQYREKNGSFKDLDDVKKVAGIDAAALDAKKDRIEF
jgi:competence protein ComEA